jgi:hypothetical protein
VSYSGVTFAMACHNLVLHLLLCAIITHYRQVEVLCHMMIALINCNNHACEIIIDVAKKKSFSTNFVTNRMHVISTTCSRRFFFFFFFESEHQGSNARPQELLPRSREKKQSSTVEPPGRYT